MWTLARPAPPLRRGPRARGARAPRAGGAEARAPPMRRSCSRIALDGVRAPRERLGGERRTAGGRERRAGAPAGSGLAVRHDVGVRRPRRRGRRRKVRRRRRRGRRSGAAPRGAGAAGGARRRRAAAAWARAARGERTLRQRAPARRRADEHVERRQRAMASVSPWGRRTRPSSGSITLRYELIATRS